MMPYRVFHVAIPPDADVSDVRFSFESASVDGTYNIEPAGVRLPAGDATDEEISKALDEYNANFDATYSADDPYPAETARYLGVGGFRKYKLVRIAYSPWQYLPKSMRMKYTPEISVSIDYKRLGKLEDHVKLYDRVREDRAREIILNYDEAQEWYPETPKPLDASDYTYIIMCTDATANAVEVLADWKRSIGVRVKVFTKEWLQENTAYPGYELERQIRYYLRDNYLAWGAEYFLIVGDHNVIPFRVCDSSSDGGDPKPSGTDTYYGELSLTDSASWDDDWDGRYAEWDDDNIDWLIELDVGRIPDNISTVIQKICEKTRDYEMDTGTWKKRGLFLAGMIEYAHEDFGPLIKCDSAYAMEEMINDWTWSGWYHCTMYEQDGIDPSVFSSTMSLMNELVRIVWNNGQYGLVNLAGHGNDYGIYRRIWVNDNNGNGIPNGDSGSSTRLSSMTAMITPSSTMTTRLSSALPGVPAVTTAHGMPSRNRCSRMGRSDPSARRKVWIMSILVQRRLRPPVHAAILLEQVPYPVRKHSGHCAYPGQGASCNQFPVGRGRRSAARQHELFRRSISHPERYNSAAESRLLLPHKLALHYRSAFNE